MVEQSSQTTDGTVTPLEELPPSAKLVAKTLEYEGEDTQAGLADSTFLSPRTVRYALKRLEENGLVTSRISFVDARQRIYSVDDAGE
ncbi:helix-turn-helix domain-containing protein [Halorubellus litoreus]|uniref:Helix-turn-helix domain-containing protein n=1 Tax=Halorubellus litoreus TaxID=755308 RepID=A0ABD5VJI5_9EURY